MIMPLELISEKAIWNCS